MIVYNSEIYHYGMPRRSGRYKWGSGKNPFHHGADVVKAKEAYIKARGELRRRRLGLVGNRAIHPIAGAKLGLGINAHTSIGKAAIRATEDSDKRVNKLREAKEEAKVNYKKEKIKEKYGHLSTAELNKKLAKVEINPSTIQNKVAETRKNRDAKLAAKNAKKIEKAKEAPNSSEKAVKKAEYKATKRVLRRDRGRVMLDSVVHPYAHSYSRYAISGLTKRGKRVERTVQQNRENMYDDRRKKLAARYAYKNSKHSKGGKRIR